MSKRRDTMTMDLLTWEPPKVAAGYDQDVAGRGTLDNRIARTLSRALRDAKERGTDRAKIAASMSTFLGRPISEDMLNKWTSEAAGSHRIALDAFIALIDATNAYDLMGLVVGNFGFVAVPEKYADIIELHQIDEHEAEMTARKQAVVARLKARR